MRYQTVNPETGQIGTTRTCITDTEPNKVMDAVSESHARWASAPLERRCRVIERAAPTRRPRFPERSPQP